MIKRNVTPTVEVILDRGNATVTTYSMSTGWSSRRVINQVQFGFSCDEGLRRGLESRGLPCNWLLLMDAQEQGEGVVQPRPTNTTFWGYGGQQQ